MLYQLRHVGALLGIVVALLVGLLAHDAAQTVVAGAGGDRTPREQGRLRLPLRHHVDVFGAVAAVIAGWGWGSPVPLDLRWRARRRRVALALLAGPAAYLVLTVLGVLLVRTVGPEQLLGEFPGRFLAALTWTWGALFIISLLPVPPLDGGRILLVLAPPTPGWQRARFQLEERNVGVALALAVVLLPRLFAGFPGVVEQLMPTLLDGLGAMVGATGLGALLDVIRGLGAVSR